MSEEALGVQPIRYLLVVGKLLAIVIGQSVNVGSIWCHGFGDCRADCCCCFVFRFDDHAEPALALSKRDQHCSTLFPNDRIRFPIPNAASGFNNIWTLCNADPPYDLSASVSRAVAFAPLLLTAQVSMQSAALQLVLIDVLINPLRADTGITIKPCAPTAKLRSTHAIIQPPH